MSTVPVKAKAVVIGDLHQIIPALTAAVRASKN